MKNLYWKQIKSTDTIASSENHKAYIVTRNGEKYLVNWGENDKRMAIAFLNARTN